MSKKLILGSFWPNFAQKRQNKILPLKKKSFHPILRLHLLQFHVKNQNNSTRQFSIKLKRRFAHILDPFGLETPHNAIFFFSKNVNFPPKIKNLYQQFWRETLDKWTNRLTDKRTKGIS